MVPKRHTLAGLNYRHLFLTGLEAGKSKVKSLEDLVSGRDPPPYREHLFPGSHMVEEARDLSKASFIRAQISYKSSTVMT